jgi:uncharacterized membrane protein
MAFGDVEVGTSATTTLTLSNSGNSTLTWSGLSTGDGVFTASATSGTVAAGGSGTVTLTFTPAAATSYSSTLTVTSDATSGTNTSTMSGTGTTALVAETRIIGLSGTMAFGDVQVGEESDLELIISNSGNSTLTWSGLSNGKGGITATPTSGTVTAGGAMTVTLRFEPTEATSYSSTLTVTSDATSGTNTTTLSGTGIAATRIIEVEGDTSFGNVAVGTTITRTVTISNSGNSTLTWSGLSFDVFSTPAGCDVCPLPVQMDDGNGIFTLSPTSGGTVAAGGSTSLTVTFTPAEEGVYYATTLTVTSDKTSGDETLWMNGNGIG